MKYLVIFYSPIGDLQMRVFDDFAHAATFRIEVGNGHIVESIEYKR